MYMTIQILALLKYHKMKKRSDVEIIFSLVDKWRRKGFYVE